MKIRDRWVQKDSATYELEVFDGTVQIRRLPGDRLWEILHNGKHENWGFHSLVEAMEYVEDAEIHS